MFFLSIIGMSVKALLDEFLISWNSGASTGSIERTLMSRGSDNKDVEKARIVFDQWVKKQKPCAEVKQSIKE